MDKIAAIRLIALRDVASKDPDVSYLIRKIKRWYSEKFSTPLHLIEDLCLEDVLQNYFECHFESLKDDDFQNNTENFKQEILDSIKSEEKKKEEQKSKSEDEVISWQYEQEVLDEEKNNKIKKKPKKTSSRMEPETSLPKINVKKPVEMKFKDLKELEESADNIISILKDL